MKTYLLPLALGALALLGAPARAAPEPVLDLRAGAAAKRILERSDKVLIAGFRVVFQPRVTEGVSVVLAGVGAEDFQRITEEAYADFKDQLQRAGVTVLDVETLGAERGKSESIPAFAAEGEQASANTGNPRGVAAAAYFPAGLPLFSNQFGGHGTGSGAADSANWRALNRLSIETKAVVLVPTIFVEFTGMTTDGRDRPANDDSEKDADAQIRLLARRSSVAVVHARIRLSGDLGSLHLRDDLEVTGTFGALKTTLTDEAVRVLAADPVQFSKLSLQGVQRFNRAISAFIAMP
jgi:nucleotide-binding universal stress UspA family protein